MAYTVLARKYRSRTFDEVIGQEPIATTLANAIKAGRIHHGYLFTGTRGVGKTSMARILAKALNCLKSDGPTTTPCCECDACIATAEGQDIDVVEIDAASNTGVDNIRELRSNAAYRPARSRYKIYIIDEVHMLSTGAFNALLKTLEEPPEHVKFILATTEIQKVPATIQSRCQRFNFRNIGPEAIAARLTRIVADEGFEAEPAAIRRIARLAGGSMRDALSILDQLLAVSSEKLTVEILDEILPPAQDEQVLALLKCAAAGDARGVLQHVDATLGQGRGLEVLCADMIETVRALMLLRVCGPETELADLPASERGEYVALSREFEESHYVQMIAMLEQLRRNVRFSGAGRALTDALLLRFAHLRDWTPIEALVSQAASAGHGDDGRAAEKKKNVAAPGRAAGVEDLQALGVLPAGAAEINGSPQGMPAAEPAMAAERRAAFTAHGRDAVERRPAGSLARPIAGRSQSAAAVAETATAVVESAEWARGTAFPPTECDDEIHARQGAEDADASALSAGSPAAELVGKDRDAALKDPVVEQIVQLFDGIVMQVERRATPAVEEDTE